MSSNENREEQRVIQGKLSILLAVTLTSVSVFRFVQLPTLSWGAFEVLGSPVGLTFGGSALLMFLVVGLVASGTLSIIQEHPQYARRDRSLVFSLITPAAGALVASAFLVQATTWPVWLAAFILGGAVIGALVQLSYRAVSPDTRGYPAARILLNVVDYLSGFVLFSMVLSQQGRALITTPVIFILSGLLAAELLSATSAPVGKVLLYSGMIALLEGELAWILEYWPISTWEAAALLTIGLYIWSGIGYQRLLGRLTHRITIEFAAIGLLISILVLRIAP